MNLKEPVVTDETDSFGNAIVDYRGGSEIHFGDPLLASKAKDKNDLRYIKLHDDLFWAATCRGFAFGSLDNDYRVPDLGTEFISKGDMKGVFDSVVNGIQMPPAIFDDYVEALFVSAGVDSLPYIAGKGFNVNCADEFPSLFFMFDSTWLEVQAIHYVRDISYEQDRSQCMMILQQGEAPFLVMGTPAYLDYYVVHDDEAGKIGFVAQKGSEKKGPFAAGDKPWINLTDAAKRAEILDTKTEEEK